MHHLIHPAIDTIVSYSNLRQAAVLMYAKNVSKIRIFFYGSLIEMLAKKVYSNYGSYTSNYSAWMNKFVWYRT